MNIVFGFLTAMASTLIVWALYFCVPTKYRSKARPYVWPVTAALVAVILYTNAMTYGPRYELYSQTPAAPERKAYKPTGEDIFASGNKWRHFDEAAKTHEERQAKDRP